MAFDVNDKRKILVGYWCCYVEGKGVLLWRMKSKYVYPQCNYKELVTIEFCKRLYPWAEVKYVEVAYLKTDADGAYIY